MKLIVTFLALLAFYATAAPPSIEAPMKASWVESSSHVPNIITPRAERRIELQAHGVGAGDGSKCKPGLKCRKFKKSTPAATVDEIVLGINVFCAQFQNPTVIKQKTHLFGVVMGISLGETSMGKIEVYISNIHQPSGLLLYEAYCKTLLYQIVNLCAQSDWYKSGGYNCDEVTGKVQLVVKLADVRLPT